MVRDSTHILIYENLSRFPGISQECEIPPQDQVITSQSRIVSFVLTAVKCVDWIWEVSFAKLINFSCDWVRFTSNYSSLVTNSQLPQSTEPSPPYTLVGDSMKICGIFDQLIFYYLFLTISDSYLYFKLFQIKIRQKGHPILSLLAKKVK